MIFQTKIHRNKVSSMFGMLAVTYYAIVHNIRGGHRNAVVGIAIRILQSLIMVAVFYIMFQLLGVRTSPIRGDFILYIMSGIFLYMTHVMTVRQISRAGSPTSAEMLHSPMNTLIAIAAASFGILYQKLIAISVMLLGYHLLIMPITIDRPIGALGMLILAWFTGVAVGLVFMALTPWMPNFIQVLLNLYIRANMIASGKMFLANSLPASKLELFDWNPLFHIIDQARGFVFLHYTPMNSSIGYAVIVSIVILFIGLMGEFFTRKQASLSWFAGR